MLDQLAGTYSLNHHTVQVIRTNNTVDTPMTSTSTDQVTATPASGLRVNSWAVTYALSGLQSAQEATALAQAGASQPISAASLLGSLPASTSLTYYTKPNLPTTSAGYSAAELSTLSSYENAGFDVAVPNTLGSGAPLGFVALNHIGLSQFVLFSNGSLYKGAADMNPVNGLGSASVAGIGADFRTPFLRIERCHGRSSEICCPADLGWQFWSGKAGVRPSIFIGVVQ